MLKFSPHTTLPGMEYAYRQLSPADGLSLFAFLLVQPAQTRKWFHPFPFNKESLHKVLSSHDQELYGLWSYGEMVAFWLLRGLSSPMPEFGLLVDRRHRRKRWGRTVTQIAQEQARTMLKRGLWLSVYADNLPARRLYRQTEFEEVRTRPDGQIEMEWYAQ